MTRTARSLADERVIARSAVVVQGDLRYGRCTLCEHAYGLRRDLIMSTEVVAAEARKIMDTEMHGLRSLPYAELVGYLDPVAHEVQAPSGRIFQIEILAVWDDRKRQHLRVLVHMDGGAGMRFKPFLGDDFIVAPDGRFIGE